MLITDARWPSLREAARRFLRIEDCTLTVPENLRDEAREIVQQIADHIPERLILPDVQTGELGGKNQFKIGGDEPPENVCWVPNATWGDFKSQVLELLEAGYPGCVGCGGPGAEGEWNERARRIKMQSNY